MPPWIWRECAETLRKGTPRNRLETTFVISRELKLRPPCFTRMRLTALRRVNSPSRPRTVVLIAPARKKKFQLASSIFRPSLRPSRFLTARQPGKNASFSSTNPGGKSVFSRMRIVADMLLADIRAFWCLRTQESDGLPSKGATFSITKTSGQCRSVTRSSVRA